MRVKSRARPVKIGAKILNSGGMDHSRVVPYALKVALRTPRLWALRGDVGVSHSSLTVHTVPTPLPTSLHGELCLVTLKALHL